MKTKLIYILITILIIYCISCMNKSVKLMFYPETETECGVITFKGSQDQIHKHHSSIGFVLVVEYADGKRDHNVSASTWSSHEVGDRICFGREISASVYGFIQLIIGLFSFLVVLFALFVLIVQVVYWIFNGEFIG